MDRLQPLDKDGAKGRRPSLRGQAVLQPPWPLQAFWPLQPWAAVLQPPFPLHEFWPLQPCFSTGCAALPAVDVVAVGSVGLGSLAAHPTAPDKIPVTAATR